MYKQFECKFLWIGKFIFCELVENKIGLKQIKIKKKKIEKRKK